MSHQVWQKFYKPLGIEVPEYADRPLGAYLEDHAEHHGALPALQYGPRTFSFSDYNQQVNKLACALRALGVKKGDVVGVHLPNIPQYVFILGAISKIGAIGSGVSPLLTASELTYQINDAQITCLFSLMDLLPKLEAMNPPPGCLAQVVFCGAMDFLEAEGPFSARLSGIECARYMDIIESQSDQFRQCLTHWNDTFMIQYTGGTTGRAKGAELSIRNLMHNPVQVGAADPPNQIGAEVYGSGFPMFHAAGLSFLLSAAVFGAHYLFVPNPRDTDYFCELMLQYPPTRLAAVPALYDMLLANPKFHRIDFSSLKVARTGAAPMSSTTHNALAKVIGKGKISDVFGMTETGPCYLVHPVERYKMGAVGFAVPGADVRIVDVQTGTRDMPCGEAGEICSSGPQTMKGYRNLPKETAHALREMDGQIWMYSGDIGYMDEEGYVYICDRAKDMMIVGGFKVFSVEVEDKLRALPMIVETALIGVPDENRPGNDVVHLYVQLGADCDNQDFVMLKAQILDYMREHMAAYKVAKHIHFIDEVPLTPIGKIDKKALRELLHRA